jgi:transcriptional regulator with XRE-family HTH domain
MVSKIITRVKIICSNLAQVCSILAHEFRYTYNMTSTNQERIAERIKQLRHLKGLTQEQISDQLNLSRSAYSKLETGETSLSYDMAVELSKIHGVALDFFYSESPIIIQQQNNEIANGYILNQTNNNGVSSNSIEGIFEKMQDICERLINKLDKLQ